MSDDAVSSLYAINNLPTLPTQKTNLMEVFQTTIDYVMEFEKQPLLQLQDRKKSLQLQIDTYAEVLSKLDSFESATEALFSSSGLSLDRSISVTPNSTDKVVATAVAEQNAVATTYNLSVTTLAKSERHVSDVQASADEALGYSGTIWLGGTGVASIGAVTDGSSILSSQGTAAVDSSLHELGYGDYTIETRNNSGQLQYRVKDADGNDVKLGTDEETGWQNFTAGDTIDTERGLTFQLSGNTGTATVEYNAAGVSVSVGASDSLVDIANDINSAWQPEGREVVASVVGTQLVLTAENTGENHKMLLGTTYSENIAGLSFSDSGDGTQAAANASFTVNGIAFSRQTNTSLTDVIVGVTLNLAADAEGESAVIEIEQDGSSTEDAINTFIEEFNSVIDYIEEQTNLTQSEDGQTYTASALTNDSVFTDLRTNLFDRVVNTYMNSGKFRMLTDIGISLGEDLRLSISDSEKFENAVETQFDDVVALLDKVSQGVDGILNTYTGSSGYIETATDNLESEKIDLMDSIQDWQVRLIQKKTDLEIQYAQMQQMLYELQATQKTWASIYSNTLSLL